MPTPKSSSIERGVKILRCFLERGVSMSVTEVAQQMDMNIATVHRYMQTMESVGLLYHRKGQRYQLGLLLAELGNAVAVSDVLKNIVEPFTQALVEELGETVHIGVLQSNEVTYLYKAESKRSLQIQTYPGKTLPAYCTGLGKVLLSQLNSRQLMDYLNFIKLDRLTPNTIADKIKLQAEIVQVRTKGFALDNEEFEQGLFCVAVPIRQTAGDIFAAISVSAPVSRLNQQNYKTAMNLLISYADKISYAMFKNQEQAEYEQQQQSIAR